ncbi:UNVERIFIED_CONTAM: hypothetical protein Sradi_2167200 [Sesamum radiatum]|uniref:Uncharacterized protein n=1 Tax=Sesamum radiatum TaxID=300843 RepID=A0AAW2T1D1_SESRA
MLFPPLSLFFSTPYYLHFLIGFTLLLFLLFKWRAKIIAFLANIPDVGRVWEGWFGAETEGDVSPSHSSRQCLELVGRSPPLARGVASGWSYPARGNTPRAGRG